MQPRDGGRRRSALVATGLALALCLAAAFAVWAFTAEPATTPAASHPTSPGASAAVSQDSADGGTPGASRRPGPSGAIPPTDLDAQAASEDAASGQTPGQPRPAKGSSFVGEVGTYLVGRGIPPGTYESAGGHDGRTCHWSRLKGVSGKADDVVASGSTDGPSRVTILPTDTFFQTKDCATWRRAAA